MIDDILQRLKAVEGRPWRYDPHHEMFVGETHVLDTYSSIIDLGRGSKEWVLVDGKYLLTERAKRDLERLTALGTFLQSCREDIRWLIEQLERRDLTSGIPDQCSSKS